MSLTIDLPPGCLVAIVSSLGVLGYALIGVVLGGLAYRFLADEVPESEDDLTPFILVGTFWPFTLVGLLAYLLLLPLIMFLGWVAKKAAGIKDEE